jgi:hypothetical protein
MTLGAATSGLPAAPASDGNRGVRALLRRLLLDHPYLLPGESVADATPTQRGDAPC